MNNRSSPTGTVTFLFTDIEGSTKLAQQYADEMPGLLARHHAILHESIEAHNGYVFRIVGDSFSVAFQTVHDALNAALVAQRNLQSESWTPATINARMGIHTGASEWMGKDHEPEYEGYATLAMASRVMSAGHGGQILLSHHAYELAKNNPPADAAFKDMGEYVLKDFLQPETMYQLIVPDLPADFPPLRTLKSVRNNLPPALTSFIGRERELAESREKLRSARLLTLIGPGGTGKTRLSLQVASEQIGHFKDGVWFVELAPISDAVFIVSTIASVFNLREVQGIPLLVTVIDYLRAKELLLLLDNCEHLVEASAQITDQLLHECPYLKIIASSREALGIDGETVYRVPSLRDNEATRLFIERATRTEPRFHETEDNASFIAQICSHLDGIPLAIELAAARVNLFTPQQIAERLDDRFKLLTGGSRSALPRQQTLHALIDWSHQTLNETEQRALRRLAVFAGGWTFEAAESVIGESEALGGLAGLVNKSLVSVEEQDGKSRYSFLETIRRYAMDKLLEAGEAPSVRKFHLDYFLKYARNAEDKLDSEQMRLWLNFLEIEHDNLRSALGWAVENDIESALHMACSLSDFWMSRSYLTEGCKWCQAAIIRAEETLWQADINTLNKVYNVLALLSINRGDHHAGQAAARQSVTLARQTGNTLRLARALNYLGLSSAFSGDIPLAFDSLHESESLCRKFGYKDDLAGVLQSLAYVTIEVYGQNALGQIQTYLEENLALTQKSVSPESLVRSAGILARLAFYRGDIDEAREHADRMLVLHQEMGDRLSITAHQSGMAHAWRQMGNLEQALALYRETIREWKEIGHRGAIAHQLECFAFIAVAQEHGERAVKLLGAAEALREVSNSRMTPQENIEYEKQLASLRTGMDEGVFTSLWAEGRAMKMDPAIDYALQEIG